MAPLPADDKPQTIDQTTTSKEGGKPWTTATIIVGAVFLFLLLAFIGTILAFYLHKRKLRNKLPASHRPKSYHPFRAESTTTTDKSSLLADAQTPDDERDTMFSRERSSVSLYVDAEPAPRRVSTQSMETVSLIPLHVTPPERQTSLAGDISNGSGVSAASSNYSRASRLSLSPIQPLGDDGDLGTRPVRPRSTSTSSMRYYGRNVSERESVAGVGPGSGPQQLPSVPKIVHTLSD